MDRKVKPYITPGEYLEIERSAEYKSEYYNGEMYALAGAGFNHNVILSNLAIFLGNHIRDKNCYQFINDMRLFIPVYSLYTYPDVMIICSNIKFTDEKKDTVLNPLLIIEILSKTTESYDRGKKFEFYRSITSLKEYVMVSSDRPLVEVYTRGDNSLWVLKDENNPDAPAQISSIDLQIPLKEIYFKVDFESKD